MRVALLLNRRSGGASNPALSSDLLAAFRRHGHQVELLEPRYKGEMTDLARKAASDGFELIVAAGGDGTINEAVNGCLGYPVLFGVIPLGTVNVWARCLGIPVGHVEGCLEILLKGQPRTVSLGRANGRAFTFSAGVGIDGEVVRGENLGLKKIIGRYCYYVKAFTTVWGYKPPRLELSIDGEPPIRCESAIFGKTPLYGDRFYLTPKASPFEKEIDVCILPKLGPLPLAQTLFKATQGGSHVSDSRIVYRKLTRATITSVDTAHMQLDGEYAGVVPVTIEALPDALRVLLPKP